MGMRRKIGGPRVPGAYHATNASPDSRRLVMGEVTHDAFLGGRIRYPALRLRAWPRLPRAANCAQEDPVASGRSGGQARVGSGSRRRALGELLKPKEWAMADGERTTEHAQNLAPCIALDRLGPYPRVYPRAIAGH